MKTQTLETFERERAKANEGKAGAHPLASSVGLAGGAALGSMIGVAGGPIGLVVGAAAGAIAGGNAGVDIADAVENEGGENREKQAEAEPSVFEPTLKGPRIVRDDSGTGGFSGAGQRQREQNEHTSREKL